MLPDLRLGVAVLTNQESGAAFQAITLHVLDYYMGAPQFDWLGAATCGAGPDGLHEAAENEGPRRRATTLTRSPRCRWPSTPATYRDPWYGDVAITRREAAA